VNTAFRVGREARSFATGDLLALKAKTRRLRQRGDLATDSNGDRLLAEWAQDLQLAQEGATTPARDEPFPRRYLEVGRDGPQRDTRLHRADPRPLFVHSERTEP
jgi:hypothetical protein